jgi:transposase
MGLIFAKVLSMRLRPGYRVDRRQIDFALRSRRLARFDLTDFEWSVIEPLLPNKPRGVPRVDDRRVLNGIFWRLRTGAPWADIPARYGPHTTCVNRFNRWRRAGVWDRLLEAVSEAYDGDIQMIDSSSIRVHQHAANGKKKEVRSRCMGRSRGGLTTKIHALVDALGLPINLKLTEGQAHDGRSAQDMFATLKRFAFDLNR